MTRRYKHMLTIATVTALSAVFAGAAAYHGHDGRQSSNHSRSNALGHERQDRCKNGEYAATFAGFYRGSGNASVDDTRVHLRATLVDKSGRTGIFDANFPTDGPYFSGTGTFLGQQMTIRGRIDAARQSRVSATYFVDGHGGRLIAELPPGTDTPDDEWDEHGSRPNGHAIRAAGASGGDATQPNNTLHGNPVPR